MTILLNNFVLVLEKLVFKWKIAVSLVRSTIIHSMIKWDAKKWKKEDIFTFLKKTGNMSESENRNRCVC
jgi:hypothetical protein